MKATLVPSILVTIALLLPASAPAADVQTTVDPKADLTRYRAFTFLDADPKAAGAITDRMVNDRLRNMIAGQLRAKNYAPVGPGQSADLGVHFSGQVTAKQRALMVGRPGPYDYGWGTTEIGGVDTLQYRQGTLYIDLVDLAKGQLLWRTRISEAFSAGYSEENWKKVDRALDEAFKKLPQRR